MHIYLNQRVLPLEAAKISPFDRGFLFGDAVYEVIRCYRQRPFCIQQHQQRLQNSLKALQIVCDVPSQLDDIATSLFAHAPADFHEHALLYVQITRGEQCPRDHRIKPGLMPTVFACLQSNQPPNLNIGHTIALRTQDDLRWHRCNIKTTNLLPNILARATVSNADEAVLIRNGEITECSSAAFFIVRDGAVFTHPANSQILPGVTREVVIEGCRALGIPCHEVICQRAELYQADALFIAATGKGIVAAHCCDDCTFALPAANAIPARLLHYYLDKLMTDLDH